MEPVQVQPKKEEPRPLSANSLELKKKFQSLDANGDNQLSFDECKTLMTDQIPEKLLRSLFKQADTSGDGFLQDDEFVKFSRLLNIVQNRQPK